MANKYATTRDGAGAADGLIDHGGIATQQIPVHREPADRPSTDTKRASG